MKAIPSLMNIIIFISHKKCSEVQLSRIVISVVLLVSC